MESMKTETIICASKSITSTGTDDGIGYGGVDEEGEFDPASRRRCYDVWEYEDFEDEE